MFNANNALGRHLYAVVRRFEEADNWYIDWHTVSPIHSETVEKWKEIHAIEGNRPPHHSALIKRFRLTEVDTATLSKVCHKHSRGGLVPEMVTGECVVCGEAVDGLGEVTL
jgi:hypothetical protein